MLFRIFIFVIVCSNLAFAETGVLEDFMREYVSESKIASSSGEEVLHEFHVEWLPILKSTASEYPDDPNSFFVLREALGISNILGLHEDSIDLASKILELNAASPVWGVEWNRELGELQYLEYKSSGDSGAAKNALKYFESVQRIYESQPEMDVSRDMVLAAVWRADLLKSLDDVAAVESYQTALDLLSAAGPGVREGLGHLKYDDEYFLSQAMFSSAGFGNAESALNLHSELVKLTGKRRSNAEYYVSLIASLQSAINLLETSAYFEDWIQVNSKDSEDAELVKFHLARTYFQQENFDLAVDTYHKLWQNDKEYFLLRDKKAHSRGKGGFSSIILFDLGMSYRKLGFDGPAEELFIEYLESFGDDQRADMVRRLLLEM